MLKFCLKIIIIYILYLEFGSIKGSSLDWGKGHSDVRVKHVEFQLEDIIGNIRYPLLLCGVPESDVNIIDNIIE